MFQVGQMITAIALCYFFSCQEVQRSAVITISQLLNASREQFHDISSDSITRY